MKFEEHRFIHVSLLQKCSRLWSANRKYESSRQVYIGNISRTYLTTEVLLYFIIIFVYCPGHLLPWQRSQCFPEQLGKELLVQSLRCTKQWNKALTDEGLLQGHIQSYLVADMGAAAQGPPWTWQTGVASQVNLMFANVLAFHMVFPKLIQWKHPYCLKVSCK